MYCVETGTEVPSMDAWIKEAKMAENAASCGMYLFHNGVVREVAKAKVRRDEDAENVTGMEFSFDAKKAAEAMERAAALPGIFHVRVWMASGHLDVKDDIMLVLIGGDIRPRVIDALNQLVGEIKDNCVVENELHEK